MSPHSTHTPEATPGTNNPPRRSFLGAVGKLGNVLLVLLGIACFAGAAARFAQNAARPAPEPPPKSMADVDWNGAQSTVYCLSCHWNVGAATAGLDVRRGHSHNVPLNEQQVRAVRDMGTIAGPDNTLVCMSCHTLRATDQPYMLADTLQDSHLCQRCHPGHYAQNTPHDLRQSAPDEKNRRGQTAVEGGPCSACHLAHSYAREIVASPLDPDGWCLTCHRAYGVAAKRARTVVMQHPESHCLQCHNSHDASHGAFLKQNAPGLCLQCHKQYDGGPAAGMHPLARLQTPLPKILVDAGATAGPNGDQVTCETCHSVHAAGHENLLVLSRKTNELCLACHADMQGRGMGRTAGHGCSPVLNGTQAAVVASWGTPLGEAGELLCVSCHKVHRAEPQAGLLAFRPKYGETCSACHPDQGRVIGSPHDLTIKFPQAQNRAGLTPLDAGVCSACHMAHDFPRERVPGPGDPDGQCMSCHLAGRIAKASHAGVEHPKTRCRDCHNPHAGGAARFLVQPEEQLCQRCHAEQVQLAGGPHDLTKANHPDKWSPAAREHGGLCLSCHVPHGGDRPDLFRIGAGESVGNHDEVCLACHADTAWSAPERGALHPQLIAPDQHKVELALVPHDNAGKLRMGCRTCHNPHGGAAPVHLARVKPGAPTEALCLHCHAEKEYVKLTGHSAERLARLGLDTDSCKPCHAMHASRDGAWGQMLSPRFLPACDPNAGRPDCVACLSCHRENGPAPFQRVASHPPRMLAAVGAGADPGYLPLFNAQGREDPQGEVVCRTCHLAHGRLDLLKALAENPNATPGEQKATRAQLRAFLEPNTCSACHGAAGRSLFLRFHDPLIRNNMHQPVR